jgi:transcriptional regulator with XRE-family HTH domain
MDKSSNVSASTLEKAASQIRKPNSITSLLGKTLKKRRHQCKKSQETLAFEASVDRTFISAIERGIANPSVLALANIAHCLDITMAELFEPIKFSLPPDEKNKRRANRAQPTLREPKSRLR